MPKNEKEKREYLRAMREAEENHEKLRRLQVQKRDELIEMMKSLTTKDRFERI